MIPCVRIEANREHPPSATLTCSAPSPRGIRLRCIHRLDLVPRPHSIVVRRTFVLRHIIGNEVHVAPVLEPQRAALALVESDRLKDQVAVRDPAARCNLLFAPPVEQITGPRYALETRLDF